MSTLQTLQEIGRDVVIVLGGISAASTLIAHLPFIPARAAQFFARVGVAFSKFNVQQKDKS